MAKKPAKAAAKPASTITIIRPGVATMRLYVKDGMRFVPCNEPITVSDAERAYLDTIGVEWR